MRNFTVSLKTICGHEVEIYGMEGEEFVAIITDYPNLDIRAHTMEDLYEEVAIALSVETELDRLWAERGIDVNHENDN